MAEATQEERWLPVVGEPGYQISDLGRARSVDRVVLRSNGQERRYRSRPRKPVARGNGHLWISFRDRNRSVHSMVLEAFTGPRPPGMWGCHANDDPTDNRLSNLRWATPRDNHLDMKRNSGHYETKRTRCPRGHRLAEPNLHPANLRKGKRACLACVMALGAVRPIGRRGGITNVQALADAYYQGILSGRRPVPSSAKTHCPRRHLLIAPNLVACRRRQGQRVCLACSRAKSAMQKAQRKGQTIDFQIVSDARYAVIMGT